MREEIKAIIDQLVEQMISADEATDQILKKMEESK